MSTLENAPRILKGALVTYEPDNPEPGVIAFQYNPHTLTRTLKPRGAGDDGARAEALPLSGPPEETIKVEIELDATDHPAPKADDVEETGIYPQLSALEMLVHPTSERLIENTSMLAAGMLEIVPPAAPLTLFVWGAKRVLPVRITEFTITEEAHDQNLTPIRAKVSLGMKVLGYNDLPSGHRGYHLYLSHLVQKENFAEKGTGSSLTPVAGSDAELF